MDRYSTVLGFIEDKVSDERLDIAVENDADEFSRLVDHRAARIAANDVTRRDEVERRLGLDLLAPLVPAFWERPRGFVGMLFGMFERPTHGCQRGDVLAIFDVPFDGAEG